MRGRLNMRRLIIQLLDYLLEYVSDIDEVSGYRLPDPDKIPIYNFLVRCIRWLEKPSDKY